MKFRAQLQEYRERIFQYKDEDSVKLLLKMLELMIHEGDIRRRNCQPEELPAYQGETLAYSTVQQWLIESPRKLNQQGDLQ
jgi:hypothetical protein